MSPDLDPLTGGPVSLGLVAAAVFVSGVVRGLTGFGFAIVATPLMSVVVSPQIAVATCVLLQLAIGAMDAPKAWPLSRGQPMGPLLLGALAATPLGMAVLRFTPTGPQRLMVAAAAMLALIAVWRGRTRARPSVSGRPMVVGLASGFLNGLAAMPGPPVVAYFLTSPIPDATARAALIVYFATTAVFAAAAGLAAGMITPAVMIIALICAPALLIGAGLGKVLFTKGDPRLFRAVGLATLVIAAAAALFKGLSSLR